MDKIAEGKRTLEHLFGEESCKNISTKLENIKPGYSDYMFYSYGEFYSDQTIDLKTKELLIVTCLITQKNAFPQLKAHLNSCKKLGITKNEICSSIIHLTMYIGFPTVINALMFVDEIYDNNI
ncbi:MAG: 4-carboxymuconolactone decarboxylase [uncultured bacterium]|nr:MAG: 4-carboxymuconolactone decarboxylase [uncultured bacterium]OGT26923.1 MAG: hypothetical protein A3B71_00760 [Gammaproteobacteria bacterium RIFCSPHIGHO2_02_FULL_42_43]OGT28271.1 MAG: hypothetical protein A2624_03220 [Gammaproteobacteria bacterium RIFCSPHIGHO2_01_FULL_42_8]OGT52141.1 MAG: hypothetical protein A3E54_06890 [Gammaproteobacteria bacterium RIFCSPHIGHO2_12_FULL_41_25]OGT62578.1 MAG: hypothetical protein A3I77_02055 [Gammaproteobacteria bacterium RIFCSPLOWO2_02_FULL_42_14]OGT86